MSKRQGRSFIKRIAIDIAGFGLIIISPFLGWLPGPGGIPIFLAGVAILARNYDWAEKLLKDFDRKRKKFVNTYLVGNKKIGRLIDASCLTVISLSVFILFQVSHPVLKFICFAAISLCLLVIVSNQRRLDRLLAKIKKHKH